VKICEVPAARLTTAGESVTKLRTGVETPVMVITAESPSVTVPSVALTKRPTTPALLPAVKVTEAVVPVTYPMALFVRVHE
jgi:hypothetical protein